MKSEKLHAQISDLAQRLGCSFIEATLEFCQDNQIDPEDLVKKMDDITKERLRRSAIDERMVRKAVAALDSMSLILE